MKRDRSLLVDRIGEHAQRHEQHQRGRRDQQQRKRADQIDAGERLLREVLVYETAVVDPRGGVTTTSASSSSSPPGGFTSAQADPTGQGIE